MSGHYMAFRLTAQTGCLVAKKTQIISSKLHELPDGVRVSMSGLSTISKLVGAGVPIGYFSPRGRRSRQQAPARCSSTRPSTKIWASTPNDFAGKNLTACGGLLPVATMLEKMGSRQLVEETLTVKRQTRAMPMYGFVLAIAESLLGVSRYGYLQRVTARVQSTI